MLEAAGVPFRAEAADVDEESLKEALLAEAILAQSAGFDLFAQVPHARFPGGRHLRSPLLALGMLWYRLKDRL